MSHPLHEPDPPGQPEDDPQIRQMVDEVNEILRSTHEHLQKHYPPFREIYRNGYNWPEIDPLRWEICRCLFFGLFQAAMTLTNHFLENLLKTALITKTGIEKSESEPDQPRLNVIEHFKQNYGPGYAEYDRLYLGDIINRAFEAELITEEQKDQLLILKDIFRNAWSHSNRKKMFGESFIPMSALHWGDEGIQVEAKENVEIADFIIGQGLFQVQFAEYHAPKYFKYVDGIARQICVKLFGEDYKSELGSLERD